MGDLAAISLYRCRYIVDVVLGTGTAIASGPSRNPRKEQWPEGRNASGGYRKSAFFLVECWATSVNASSSLGVSWSPRYYQYDSLIGACNSVHGVTHAVRGGKAEGAGGGRGQVCYACGFGSGRREESEAEAMQDVILSGHSRPEDTPSRLVHVIKNPLYTCFDILPT